MQRLPNQVPALGRDVVIQLPEYHNELALDVPGALEAIVVLACAQRRAVDVGREVAHCGRDARVQRAAVREVSA